MVIELLNLGACTKSVKAATLWKSLSDDWHY